jgi:hypothetical protein
MLEDFKDDLCFKAAELASIHSLSTQHPFYSDFMQYIKTYNYSPLRECDKKDELEQNKTKQNKKSYKVDVFTQDIHGIAYFMDKHNNVYKPEDIVSNKINPKIIAKYIVNDGIYSIPELYK